MSSHLQARVLVVEDDMALAGALSETLRVADVHSVVVDSGEAALQSIDSDAFDLVITDVSLNGMDGFTLLSKLNKQVSAPPVIMMTAFGTIERAVRAMKEGAVDYLAKPFRPRELIDKVRQHIAVKSERGPIAVDKKSIRLLGVARRVAAADATVLLQGESGTGKEVLARFIHDESPRRKKPFVAVNCAAIPETLLESILFGHEKGTFTNALQSRDGKFQQANSGTLLLDEISEMNLGLQAKLLRVLQEREVERVGGRDPEPIDVRVIATTNRDLKQRVREGSFREDLFYRISVFPIMLPPLRERADDIAPLAIHLLAQHAERSHRRCSLSPSALLVLRHHSWPGNVRELSNVLYRAMILCPGDEISVESLALAEADTAPKDENPSLDSAVSRTEFEVIAETLRKHSGHRAKSAEALGVSERTLRYKLARFREQGFVVADLSEKVSDPS